jgi:F-type H+-transporting ATPase subunit epsilon
MVESAVILHCTVITPESVVVDEDVFDVVLPAHDGLLGVLPGHAPLLCQMGCGLLKYRDTNMAEHIFLVDGGFGHIRHNQVTILTRHTVAKGEISKPQAEDQLKQAQALPLSNLTEVQTRNAAVNRAQQLIHLAELGQ